MPIQTSTSYLKDLYRRIPYKVEGNNRVIGIFYATDRKVETPKGSSLSFKSDLAGEMTYGTMDVRINPDIKIGKVVPRRLQWTGTIGIDKIDKLEEAAFMQRLADAVKASPHHSLLVLVFGYKDKFEYTTIKTAYFAYLLDVNTPVLLFDWPGDQAVSIMGYEKARSYASMSGPYLGELLAKITREIKPERLWVEASSLGCQVVCDAFDHMYKYDDLADAEAEIDHVVLTAPDVGEDDFDLRFKDELAALSRKVTTYVSSNDDALLISGMITGEKKLGRQRLSEPKQLEEAKDMLYLKSLAPDRITVIDVTPINRASFRHGYYLEAPEFYDDFYMRLFAKEANVNRRLYLLKVKDGTDYWVMRGGR